MKRYIALTVIFLLMSILTSCENSYPNNIDSKTSFSSENFSDSISNSTESVILNTDIATETLSKNLDIKEIMDLFGDFGAFNWEYLGYDSAWDRITSGDGTDGFRNENDRYFGKIVNADIATYSALIEKLKSMLTDKCIEDTLENILDWFSTNENDDLYVQNRGAGGYLGYDFLRINSIGYPDEETITLDMSRVGEKENWGYDEDLVEDFQMILKKTDGGLRIDEITGNPLDLACLRFVVYNNVYMVLDNVPEYVKKLRE